MERSVLLFQNNDPSIGLRVRKPVAGPEGDLLNCFIEKKTQDRRNRSDLAVFLEPEIASGFPDAVIAKYNADNLKYWNDSRLSLRNIDIKILYYMLICKHTTSSLCCKQLGMSKSSLLDCLENLLDANLIMRKDSEWVLSKNTADHFLVSELISVEAKINNWKKVFEQASINMHFANSSYVLTPTKSPSKDIQAYARNIGIGIYSCSESKVTRIVTPHTQIGVMGYTSLLFNEWLGRRLYTR